MGNFWRIISVKNGINGCNRRNAFSRTVFKTYSAVFLARASSPYKRAFVNSMYQSQNSDQMNSYISRAASPNSNLSRFSVTLLAVRFNLEIIHLSAKVKSVSAGLKSASKFSRFISKNLEAFQILFAKFRADSTRCQENLKSLPGVLPVTNIKRNESAPYLSITSTGSIPFPNDFDILRFCSSRTSP